MIDDGEQHRNGPVGCEPTGPLPCLNRLPSAAHLLEPANLLVNVVDLRFDSADLVHDLHRALGVARCLGIVERGVELPQFHLEPGQLLPKLSELSAARMVRPTPGVACAVDLAAASRLSGSRPGLSRDVRRHHTNEQQRAECWDYPSHCILLRRAL
jgi:hypothetical protein